jgi:hypothetical protein
MNDSNTPNLPPQDTDLSLSGQDKITPAPTTASAGGMKVIQPLSGGLTADNDSTATSQINPVAPPVTPPTVTTKPVQSGSSRPLSAGQKVIQPSAAILQEMQSRPSTPIPQPRPVQPQPQPASATSQNNSFNAAEQSGNPKAKSSTQFITIAVMALGAFIAVPALVSLVGWAKVISFGYISGTSAFVTVTDVLYLLLGVGIVLRKELARIVYVFFAVIGLLLTVYGTYSTFNFHGVTNYDKTRDSQNISQDQQQITSIQNNDFAPGLHLTNAQKQQQIQRLQQDIANAKKDQAKISGARSYADLIPGYLLAIIPLVFLTRPSVKEVFS